MLKLALPIIIANLLQTAYNLTDTFWVGRLGKTAVAAVSLSFPVLFFMISLGSGLATAGSILVAQYKGKKDQKAVDFFTSQTFLMVFFVSVVISVLGYFLSPVFIRLMNPEADVAGAAISYLKISFIGTVFLFGFFVFQGLMRAIGKPKLPMFIVLGTVLLNLVLDPFFIFGYSFMPSLGVSGAALATIFTQLIATVTGLFILFSGKKGIKIHLTDLRPDFKIIKKMFRLGFPSSLERSSRSLGMLMLTFLVSGFGTTAIAAYGIGIRILSFIIVPAMGISMATSVLVGQSLGSENSGKAREIAKKGSLFGFLVLSASGIVIFFFARPISSFFIPGQAEVINSSAFFIKLISFSFGFLALQFILSGILRAAGNTIAPMLLSFVLLFVLRFPIALVLSRYTSLVEKGIWWSFPISNIIGAAITIAYFSRSSWHKRRLTKQIKPEAL